MQKRRICCGNSKYAFDGNFMAISALAERLPTSATLAHYAIGQLCPMYALCLIVAINLAIKQSLPLNGQRVLNCALLISYVCPEYGRVSVIYFLYTFAQCCDLILNKVSLKKRTFPKVQVLDRSYCFGSVFFKDTLFYCAS